MAQIFILQTFWVHNPCKVVYYSHNKTAIYPYIAAPLKMGF